MDRDKYIERLNNIERKYNKICKRVTYSTITDMLLSLMLDLWIARAKYEFWRSSSND